ncbi:MAG: YHS domain-containing protein [Deltaproteobacteria bacterium]|nr:YHS domain-containing protein [Deltaproteobacteria bacterium]
MKPIIILLIIFFAVRFIRKGLLKKAANPHQAEKPRPGAPAAAKSDSEELVLDPVCDSYIPMSGARTLNRGGKVDYFCSDECKDKFLKSS